MKDHSDNHGFLRRLSKEFSFKSQDIQHKICNLKNLYDHYGKLTKIGKHLHDSKGEKVTDEKYKDTLNNIFDSLSPFIYLSKEQKLQILNDTEFYNFSERGVLYSDNYENENMVNSAFVLIEGEVFFYKNKHIMDILDLNCLFGYDGPIFKRRNNTTICEKGTTIAVISEKSFLLNIQPFSKFCTYISNSIIYKDKILDNLNNLKDFILQSVDKGPIDIHKLIDLYKHINPCLHPKSSSDELDISAWLYALNRLPESIHESFVFVLINHPPKLLSTREELLKEKMPFIKTKARNRDVFRYLHGKNLVLVREMETDVLDFFSNMCIHIVETQKIRRSISSPMVIEKLYDNRENFDECINILKNQGGLEIDEENCKSLKKMFGNKFADMLIDLCLHYQDFNLSISKLIRIDHNPVESWVQNLWSKAKVLLSLKSSVDEVEDLVVDIFQGSKRTLLGCISPHLFMNKEEILNWGKSNKIELKTKFFKSESDLLLAYSFYYYKAFPEKAIEKEEIDRKHGIVLVENTYSTGVQVLLIDPNQLNPSYVDPSLNLKPASKNHLILHIGYTFGAQAGHIIRPLLMLFGSKARSMNIIGKAGGLTGNRTDILIANNIFYDKTHEIVNLNTGELNEKQLMEDTGSDIHVGAMLTVAGTILQNSDLLYFYKYVRGCIGLEMEGYFYAKEIEIAIKHGILRNDFITRCFYYASDLPLDPNQNLAMEEGNVSWDEGVGSMNSIQRFILKQVIG